MRMEIVPRPNAIAKNTTNNKNKNKTRNKQLKVIIFIPQWQWHRQYQLSHDTNLHDACRHGMNLTEILTAQQMGHNSSTSTDSCWKGASLNKYLNTELPGESPVHSSQGEFDNGSFTLKAHQQLQNSNLHRITITGNSLHNYTALFWTKNQVKQNKIKENRITQTRKIPALKAKH